MRHEKNEAFKNLDQWKKKCEEANNKMISMQTDVCQYERDVNDINVKHLHELQVMQSHIQQNQLKLAEQNNIIEKLTDELREMKKIKEENNLVLEQKKLLGLEVNKMKLEHNEMVKVLSEKFQSDLNAQVYII
ncbi:hypothetical protein HELRODRAFT_191765 [Helobdella robusta]|uniref:Uncharacterized protein n=1 Tax=Helobdella robusta TaxID=6412 RepID=T1FTA8_HELRO|nr:hypothetical protein HELRODRAFT_191765 [Helobdella robusta]ESO04404.1 hypothetical protein HELRODRAFT_191765 [Helobdella robusta]